MRMEERKPEGAAVMSTERTEEVGSLAARVWASGPRERRRAGLLVGRAVMPAREALDGNGWLVDGRGKGMGWDGGEVQLEELVDVRLALC